MLRRGPQRHTKDNIIIYFNCNLTSCKVQKAHPLHHLLINKSGNLFARIYKESQNNTSPSENERSLT